MRFFLFFLLLTSVYAKEYRAVFDCSSGDALYVKSRMWLVGKTMDMFQKEGDHLDVIMTLHGKCSVIASEDYELYVTKKDIAPIQKAQNFLQKLLKRGVKVYVCAMSLAANSIDEEGIMEGITISPNSFIQTIKAQNSGYALMSFK